MAAAPKAVSKQKIGADRRQTARARRRDSNAMPPRRGSTPTESNRARPENIAGRAAKDQGRQTAEAGQQVGPDRTAGRIDQGLVRVGKHEENAAFQAMSAAGERTWHTRPAGPRRRRPSGFWRRRRTGPPSRPRSVATAMPQRSQSPREPRCQSTSAITLTIPPAKNTAG